MKKITTIKQKLNLKHVFAIVLFCQSFAYEVYAEPSAYIISDINQNLLDKIKAAIGESSEAPQSAFEARKRAQIAANFAEEVLRSEGYYNYTITPDISDEIISNDNIKIKAILKIETGPRYLIKNPEIDWVTPPPKAEIISNISNILDSINKAPARAETIITSESQILGTVLAGGYADAEILPRKIIIDHADLSMNPKFKINSGLIAKLGLVNIIGPIKTDEKWLYSIVPWKPNDEYTPEYIKEFEKRLLDTGAYDAVNISLGENDKTTGLRNVNLSLQNRARLSVETQLSYSTNEGVAIEGRLGRYNIFNRADSLISRIVFGQVEKRLETELILPHFYKPNKNLALSIAAFEDDTKAYLERGLSLKAELTQRYGLNSFYTYGINSDLSRTREPSFTNPTNGIERDFGALSIIGAFLIDRTNNILDPIKGYKADARGELTSITGDANLSYFKIVTQASYYYDIGKKNKQIFAIRGRIGSIIGATIPELPSGRRLYSGGGGSVRGYGYQSIGPRYNDAEATPVGGLSSFETSMEYRRKINDKFSAVGFFDTGSLGIDSTPSFDEFRAAVGLGVRYNLGFAPLRLDVAYPLDKPKGEQNIQIYIGVGQSF